MLSEWKLPPRSPLPVRCARAATASLSRHLDAAPHKHGEPKLRIVATLGLARGDRKWPLNERQPPTRSRRTHSPVAGNRRPRELISRNLCRDSHVVHRCASVPSLSSSVSVLRSYPLSRCTHSRSQLRSVSPSMHAPDAVAGPWRCVGEVGGFLRGAAGTCSRNRARCHCACA
jgi:hypothetical protein